MTFLENRIPPPIVALLCGAVMVFIAGGLPALDAMARGQVVAAVAIALAGLAICLAGVVSFRRAKTTVNPLRPETASSLVGTGIYRVTRNPMYLGFALCLAGWTVWLGSLPALAGVALFVLYIDRLQIVPEERALKALFGEEYAGYCARVRRWV